VTFGEARRIIVQVDGGNIRQAQVILMAHAFDLDNRARRLTYFYPNCEKCKDFLRIFEAATLSLAQENYISAFFAIMPLVEGLLLRWMGHGAAQRKPDFGTIKSFVSSRIAHIKAQIPNWLASDNLKAVAEFQMEFTEKILLSHVFENHLTRISDLNRHLALHLLDVPDFCNSFNVAQLWIIIDNMVDCILWDEGHYGKAWNDQFNDSEVAKRRMYEMAFHAARIFPSPPSRFSDDINSKNNDLYARWVRAELARIA
jgi:hypothetical protein